MVHKLLLEGTKITETTWKWPWTTISEGAKTSLICLITPPPTISLNRKDRESENENILQCEKLIENYKSHISPNDVVLSD